MLAKKKKLGKKQIQEDKLVTYYSKSLEFFEDYKNQLFIGAAIIIVIVAAIVYFGDVSRKENVKASAALAKTIPLFEAGNYQNAIDGNPNNDIPGLKEIVENYDGTEQGEIAKIYLGHSYFYQEQYDMALEYYSDFSGSNDLYEAASLAGQAACYEAKGEFERAAELYKDAASVYDNNASNGEYLLNAGINYIKIEDYQSAKTVLQKIKDDFEMSSAARKVDKYLARVNLEL